MYSRTLGWELVGGAKSVAPTAPALLVAAGLAACASHGPALGTHTAQVTINGRDTGEAHRVDCS